MDPIKLNKNSGKKSIENYRLVGIVAIKLSRYNLRDFQTVRENPVKYLLPLLYGDITSSTSYNDDKNYLFDRIFNGYGKNVNNRDNPQPSFLIKELIDPIIFWSEMSIYLITNSITGKPYIGQTASTSLDRFNEHKRCARHYQRVMANPDKYNYKGSCTYLYRAMNKYGFDNFEMLTLANCDEDKLDELEIHWIRELGSLAPNGYNLTTGGGHFHHCDLTKQTISKKVKETMTNNIDNFRTSDKTKGLLPYIAYINSNGYESYYVNNHPYCKRKHFSASTYGSIEIARNKCNEFVQNLNDSKQIHVIKGPGDTPVKGLRPRTHGYQVRKTVNGKVIEKSFNDKTNTKEENLHLALDYINSLK